LETTANRCLGQQHIYTILLIVQHPRTTDFEAWQQNGAMMAAIGKMRKISNQKTRSFHAVMATC
jgi:hypothetical protein